MAEIRYRICDRCEQKIDDKDFFELSVCQIPKKRETNGLIRFDICLYCNTKLLKFLREGKADE